MNLKESKNENLRNAAKRSGMGYEKGFRRRQGYAGKKGTQCGVVWATKSPWRHKEQERCAFVTFEPLCGDQACAI